MTAVAKRIFKIEVIGLLASGLGTRLPRTAKPSLPIVDIPLKAAFLSKSRLSAIHSVTAVAVLGADAKKQSGRYRPMSGHNAMIGNRPVANSGVSR